MPRPDSSYRWLCAFALLAAMLLTTFDARAYPWMIGRGYTQCGACHFDPSGAGQITRYGRLVADDFLSLSRNGGAASSPSAFAFGAIEPPAWLSLGADARLMVLRSKTAGVPAISRTIWMQLDAEAAVSVGGFTAAGSLGYAPEGALGAALTRHTEDNLISRQHWLGYDLTEEGELKLRLGRMNLPFGIRTIEHTLWTRRMTRTTINDEQQYGAAVYVSAGPVQAELMGIAGNLQLRPDQYRERGYSAYVELAPIVELALGVSSLITHRHRDTIALAETWRHAHGAFGRWSTPYEPLVLLAEVDYVLESSRGNFHERGPVGFIQADWEPVRGMHLLATGEANRVGTRQRRWSYGGWLSYLVFLAPQADVRLDAIYQSLGYASERSGVVTFLLQGHVSL